MRSSKQRLLLHNALRRLDVRQRALVCHDGGNASTHFSTPQLAFPSLSLARHLSTSAEIQSSLSLERELKSLPEPRCRRGGRSTKGLLHATAVCLERNVVRNTLADTPSGYVQDPRAAPKEMPRYDGVSRVGAAALRAMEQEKELLEREELAFRGYTTPHIQELKRVVIESSSTVEDLEAAVAGLAAELETLLQVVGQEVEKPISQERLLLLKWQQRQQRLHDREHAFRVAPSPKAGYRVVQQADGTEVLERPGRDTLESNVEATDDAYLSQPVEMEELPAEALVPERVVVTVHDVNHVRYVMGLALRRLSKFEEAEQVFYSVLADDVTNVDVVESLLEMDLGVEGWEPRIRVLFDYLVTEYDRAIAEGRLQRPEAAKDGGSEEAESIVDAAEEEGASRNSTGKSESGVIRNDAAVTDNSDKGVRSSLEQLADDVHSSADAKAASREAAAGTQLTHTTAIARTRSNAAKPYATVPQAAPIVVALSILSDIIVEAAAQKCAADGEGATSRFFIESLGPIVRALGRDYAPALLEALFQAVDEQHFTVRYDAADVSPAARKFALSLIIAFLKALTARRIHEMLPNPVQFEFFTLAKLHAALRRADRTHESYHICEKMMQLYRANSSLHRARRRRSSAAMLTQSASAFLTGNDTAREVSLSAKPVAGAEESEVKKLEERGEATAAVMGSRSSPLPNQTQSASALNKQSSSISPPEKVASAENTVATPSTLRSELDEFVEPPDVLDDQDADYREAFFQYVNDRARDSPVLGRRLCLEAMQEFPKSAAPWETLALLLHKENPKKNLPDAIIAARHAMLLEPLNLGVIVTLANFYKAAQRYELHERMLDRYRLLVYMAEEGASEADMLATAAEVEALDRETPEAQDLVEETGREMSEYMFRMEQAMTYSMPIDKETREFRSAPVSVPSQQEEMRPAEVGVHESDPGDRLRIGVAMRPLY